MNEPKRKPGRPPGPPRNKFAAWMIFRGLTSEKLGEICAGIHPVTIKKWRQLSEEDLERTITPHYSRTIRALFPDCPLPVARPRSRARLK